MKASNVCPFETAVLFYTIVLFSYQDDVRPFIEPFSGNANDRTDQAGEGLYELLAVVSHLGKSADHGHYVCHIKKENQY